ncbi:hypothetical protein [Alicyclobacillus sp. SO9]|uniref:hypothetical protein n=1 Tax=Alicyclobacillus sp. SO9 TaxID=2665646 RepID=UPI0018E79B23|nr:hypothetical protein [Alicyclobacillus sp. SO9]
MAVVFSAIKRDRQEADTRWLSYERFDTVIGSVVVVVAATALIVTTAFAFQGTTWLDNL